MSYPKPAAVGYVLKMYPRFSETFILNEILAHEAAGLELHIFSLRPATEGRFHEALARVRSPVTYLPGSSPKSSQLWADFVQASQLLPDFWTTLGSARLEAIGDVYQAILLAREVASRGITHLHAHFGTVATTVARLAARFAGIPYSFTAHAKDIFHNDVQPADLERKLSQAAAVVTVSDYNLQYLRQTYGQAAARTRRIYNGLDLERFTFCAPTARPQRIVAVGRLVEKKGFGVLIDACARLAASRRRFHTEIIGTGPLEEDLRHQISQLGLESRVSLIGPRPQRVVRQHVQQAAVFAAPCVVGQDGNRDGLPTVLLEAMALGTPCVATDVTGIPEVVRPGSTGLQVPQGDAGALAEALGRLLDDSALRVQLATAARQLIEAEFDIRQNAARLRQIFATSPPPAGKIDLPQPTVEPQLLPLEVV